LSTGCQPVLVGKRLGDGLREKGVVFEDTGLSLSALWGKSGTIGTSREALMLTLNPGQAGARSIRCKWRPHERAHLRRPARSGSSVIPRASDISFHEKDRCTTSWGGPMSQLAGVSRRSSLPGRGGVTTCAGSDAELKCGEKGRSARLGAGKSEGCGRRALYVVRA